MVSGLLGVERCPSCGITTGFAHMTRGNWSDARAANPGAPVLFVVWALGAMFTAAVGLLGMDLIRYEIPALLAILIIAFAFWIVAAAALA